MVRSGTIRESRPGVARSSAVVLLPHAGRFRFAAGVRNPPGRPFVATGTAPAGHPRRRAITAANSYLAGGLTIASTGTSAASSRSVTPAQLPASAKAP
jgi:hypothetical protein